MLKTQQLQQYLHAYQALDLHQNNQLKDTTIMVMDWQKQRMQNIHTNLFHHEQYAFIHPFFFGHFYHFDALELLASQLQLALDQKIKLDRWLPNEVLESIINGFTLALMTLEADMQLAKLLIQKNLSVNTENLLAILPEAPQSELRLQQLELLEYIGTKLYKFSHSFLLRSAFKLAQNKIQQRGFSQLHHYIDNGMSTMRAGTHSLKFFKLLVHQEKIFLAYLDTHHPTHLDVYYDPKTELIIVSAQPNKDGCSS